MTNHSREVFGEDADEFNPGGWLRRHDEPADDFEARLRRMRSVADFVFGGGSRVCMGRYFAQLELWKLFATLYSAFNLSPGRFLHTFLSFHGLARSRLSASRIILE